MTRFYFALLLAGLAQAAGNPFAGRWDITIKTADGTSPRWMELVDNGGDLKVRVQPSGGAVRDISGAKTDGSKLLLTVSDATAKQPAVTWELTPNGDTFSGIQKAGERTAEIAGVRAPSLDRKAPKAWSAPETLFNGNDLSGWEPMGTRASHWMVKNGELFNEEKGANIKTTRRFDDFKLHIEVNCPEHCNSGIYLRGRYEIQVGTEGRTNMKHEMGAIYGYVAPAVDMPPGSGEWQVFDITLVGRHVTVVRNGTKIHDNEEIPGITGGAMDSNEAEPGPIFLQGDHTGGLRYRNITIATAKR